MAKGKFYEKRTFKYFRIKIIGHIKNLKRKWFSYSDNISLNTVGKVNSHTSVAIPPITDPPPPKLAPWEDSPLGLGHPGCLNDWWITRNNHFILSGILLLHQSQAFKHLFAEDVYKCVRQGFKTFQRPIIICEFLAHWMPISCICDAVFNLNCYWSH